MRSFPDKYGTHLYIIFFYASNGAFMPFLGFWYSEQGLTNQQIGLLASLGPLIGLVAQPLWGILCDRFGIQKQVLAFCILITPVIAFGYMFADVGLWLLIVTSLLYSFFYCAVMPLSDSIAVNHAIRRGQSYGAIRVLGSISYGIVIIPLGMLYSAYGNSVMFAVNLLMMIAVAVALSGVKSEGDRPHGKGSLVQGAAQLLRQKTFLFFLLLVAFVSIGSNFHRAFFAVYVGQLGGEVSEKIGMLNAVSSISEIPMFLLAGYWIRKFGYFPVLTFVALGGALRWWLLSLEPSYVIMMASQSLHGISFALFMAVGVTFAFQMSPEGLKNTGQTLFTVVNASLANIIASNGGGWLMDHTSGGFSMLFGIGAICSVIGSVGFITLSFYRRMAMTAK